MNNIYDGFLNFKGTFRPYQRRILDYSNEYLKDNKLIVQDPKYNIEVKHNLVNAIIIEIRYTVRQ